MQRCTVIDDEDQPDHDEPSTYQVDGLEFDLDDIFDADVEDAAHSFFDYEQATAGEEAPSTGSIGRGKIVRIWFWDYPGFETKGITSPKARG